MFRVLELLFVIDEGSSLPTLVLSEQARSAMELPWVRSTLNEPEVKAAMVLLTDDAAEFTRRLCGKSPGQNSSLWVQRCITLVLRFSAVLVWFEFILVRFSVV